jgi:HlyD family secretion protein
MPKRKRWLPWIGYMVTAAAAAAGIGYLFRPVPLAVEAHRIGRSSVVVTVDEDGKTRIKEKYVVSSPLAGKLQRVELHAGDPVHAGKTVITTLNPTAPALLDIRARTEAQASVKAAEALRDQAIPLLEKAKASSRVAEEEFDRAKQLSARNSVTHEELDRAELRMLTAREELKAAQFAVQVAEHELELARAALMYVTRADDSSEEQDDWAIEIRSPITGQVLRVFQESASVVSAGTPLVEVGDATDLEVVVDVLSSDAVKIAAGNEVLLEEWGGSRPLQGRVRRVEPSGFTKISALGVEEQRVNVIIDFVESPAERKPLGDDFRVEASIVIDKADDVLSVPNSALFQGSQGAVVYVVEEGRARRRSVTLGRRSKSAAEVLSGLTEGELVVVYPGDQVRDGTSVRIEIPQD